MSRLEYNRKIIKVLSHVIEKYPDWRFGQILTNCDIITGSCIESGRSVVSDPFYVESKDIFERMKLNPYCNDSRTVAKQ